MKCRLGSLLHDTAYTRPVCVLALTKPTSKMLFLNPKVRRDLYAEADKRASGKPIKDRSV